MATDQGPSPLALARVMPCPDCGHDHLHLPCDFCPCTAQTVPGVHLDST